MYFVKQFTVTFQEKKKKTAVINMNINNIYF